jgi:GTP-binding protein YchF
LTRYCIVLGSAKAEAANYPFCTIEPNVGIVDVPDPKLKQLCDIVKGQRIVPANTQIVDIAGIVKGASKGEGLGNQFLNHIREVDAILQVVRCFVNDDIIHVDGSVDPARDVEVINTELILADLQTLEKRIEKEKKGLKSGDKEAKKNVEQFEALRAHMDKGNPARSFPVDPMDEPTFQSLFLLTRKPILYVANSCGKPEEKVFVDTLAEIAVREKASHIVIDCALEAEIAGLPEGDRAEFLNAMGLKEPGLNRLIRSAFDLLGLMTYYTAGVKEVHAWTIPKGSKAPQAAGVIHSDFEKGFICAECIKSDDLIRLGLGRGVEGFPRSSGARGASGVGFIRLGA